MGKYYKKRFEKGEQVPKDVSVIDLAQNEYLYVGGKILHVGWYANWKLNRWKSLLDEGEVYYAVPTQAYFDNMEKLREKELKRQETERSN